MNKEWIKKFIKLVDSKATMKAFQRELGISREELKYHLTQLDGYRKNAKEDDEAKSKKNKSDLKASTDFTEYYPKPTNQSSFKKKRNEKDKTT